MFVVHVTVEHNRSNDYELFTALDFGKLFPEFLVSYRIEESPKSTGGGSFGGGGYRGGGGGGGVGGGGGGGSCGSGSGC